MNKVPPVAYASSFTVGIPSPLSNACDGIGRRKDERGRPLPIYKPERTQAGRSASQTQKQSRKSMPMNEAVQRSFARHAKGPDALSGSPRRKSPQGAAFISGSINISWSTGMTFQFC